MSPQGTPSAASAGTNPRADLDAIVDLVSAEMKAVNRLIEARLDSDVAAIRGLAAYLINSGGKRLRPLTVILSARALDYRGRDDVALATIIEFIHTATLLHDDVVDGSEMRRGQATANDVWGNEASVLVGDFLYSRAFEMMVELDSMRVMDILAHTTNAIAEGEVMQLMNVHSAEVSEQDYLETIYRKTARLFEAAAQLGAVITGQPEGLEQDLARYGRHLGLAFQLVDDVLDYAGSASEIGKNLGDDLAEGKPTLPLIHALAGADEAGRRLLTSSIENGDRSAIAEVVGVIESGGSLSYTTARAREEARLANEALANVPDSPYRDALAGMARFAVARSW